MLTTSQIEKWVANDEVWRFYTSRTWRRVRDEVLAEFKHECQDCKAAGKYTKATMVHHEKPLRQRPDLALSKRYVDATGEHRQLTPLCDDCHNIRHTEHLQRYQPKEPVTPERWD